MIRRTLFTLAATISLMLFITTAIVWIVDHSLRYDRQFGQRARGAMQWERGDNPMLKIFLSIKFNDPPKYAGDMMSKEADAFTAGRPDFDLRAAGFFYHVEHQFGWVGRMHSGELFDFGIGRILALPAWFVLWITGLLPAIWIYRAWKRPSRGCCQACGYNLTGNTSGVCPECGAAIADSMRLRKDVAS